VRAVGGVVALGLSLVGCGVSAEQDASLAGAEDVPFGLLDPAVESESPLEGATGTAVPVFLVRGEGPELVGVARLAPSGALSSRLDVLAEGPTPSEAASGLRSALAGPEAVTSVDLSGGVARVDLSRDFTELSGSDQLLAIAQMVFTLTERADVSRVGFTLDGEPVQVPRGDGSLTSDPVARGDYADLT
jgi:hypothetical protein